MKGKCKYPGCHQLATRTWALVPLCPRHQVELYQETFRYYNGKNDKKITDEERVHYFAIAHMIPWRRKR